MAAENNRRLLWQRPGHVRRRKLCAVEKSAESSGIGVGALKNEPGVMPLTGGRGGGRENVHIQSIGSAVMLNRERGTAAGTIKLQFVSVSAKAVTSADVKNRSEERP